MSPVAHRPANNPLVGIGFKVISVTVFVAMSAFIKAAGELPAGQLVFFRSFFAILPVLVYLGYQGELRSAISTKRPMGHLVRGLVGVTAMALTFFALTRLPLPEAITLNYAQPLFVIAFSALFLGEVVRAYRWTAVFVGMIGVVIVSWPKLALFGGGATMGNSEIMGVIAALGGAAVSALAMLQIHSLVQTEKSAVIVIWFSLTASATALLSLPLGWEPLSGWQFVFLMSAGICGGIAQIFLTEAYRYADASTVAPFEYTSMILAIIIGYLVFGDPPTIHVVVGGLIVIAAGIFIVWRERQLGLERRRARQASTPQ